MFFSWYLNRTEIDVEAHYRYSIIDGNLIITNASVISDYGKYQCRAENGFGTIFSREALLQFACKLTLNLLTLTKANFTLILSTSCVSFVLEILHQGVSKAGILQNIKQIISFELVVTVGQNKPVCS